MNSFASGTAGIIKNGAGTLTIGGTAPNTYNGTTRLNAGILSLARDSALGTGLLDIGGNGTIQATSSDTRIVTNPVKFTSSAFSIGGSGALSFSGDADVGTGTTTVTVGRDMNSGRRRSDDRLLLNDWKTRAVPGYAKAETVRRSGVGSTDAADVARKLRIPSFALSSDVPNG